MRKIKGKGIFLERSEFTPHRNNDLGWDFWDPDFQVVLRSIGECSHFFPQAIRPEGKSGGVLFSLGEGSDERLGRSRKLLRKRLPKREVDRFVKALESLQDAVRGDEVKTRTYNMIRLPDPAVQPERFRIHGPIWNRHMAVLWGYDSMGSDGKPLANMTIQEGLERLKRASDPYYTLKVTLVILFRLFLALLLCAGLVWGAYWLKCRYDAYQQIQADIPRCMICGEKLEDGLCPNICVNCGTHSVIGTVNAKRRKHGPTCRFCSHVIAINRQGNVVVSPIGVVPVGGYVFIQALHPGTFTSSDWPTIHADKGEKVYYRWDTAGNYSVRWQPDAPGGDRIETSIPIYVRERHGDAYELDCGASLLVERLTDSGGKVTELKVIDCSFDDRKGNTGVSTQIRWGDDGVFVPFNEQTSRKTVPQFMAAESGVGRKVTIRASTTMGELEKERVIDANFNYYYPGKANEVAELSPTKVIVGETVLCKNPVFAFNECENLEADFGSMRGKQSLPVGYLDAAYHRAGKYNISVADASGKNQNVLRAEIDAYDLKDMGSRILDLSPPSVQMGNEVVATDVSGVDNIVRREIRWGYSNEFIRFKGNVAVQSFGHPGIYEVTLRIWTNDGHYVEETRNVKVVDDAWQAIMSVEPNPAYPGQSIVVSDMSVIPPGFDVIERQIRWYPSLEFTPMPGDHLHRVIMEPGRYKAVVRMLDQNGEYHYGQAGLTVADNICAVPILQTSAKRIRPGQTVLFTDLSHDAPFCKAVKKEFRKDGSLVFQEFTNKEFYVEYPEPGVYHPEFRITCEHGKTFTDEQEITVSSTDLEIGQQEFEVVQIGQKQIPGSTDLEISFIVRQKENSALALDSYKVTYFTVGGRPPMKTEDGKFSFAVSPGCINEVVTEVSYLNKDRIRGACQVYFPPIELLIKIKE